MFQSEREFGGERISGQTLPRSRPCHPHSRTHNLIGYPSMTQSATDYRKYLEPRTLARIHSLDLRARLIVEGLMTGMHRSPYQGISVEFAQHRPYVPGDDIRHVDWKVFAKSDKVYLKQYLEETNLHLICVVDASESMGYGLVGDGEHAWTKYDCATAIAASLSYLAIQQQD